MATAQYAPRSEAELLRLFTHIAEYSAKCTYGRTIAFSLSLPTLPTFRCLRHPSPSIAAVGLVLIVAPRLASPYALAHTDIAENYQHETKVVEFVPPHELLQRIDFSLPEQGTPLDADLTGTHPNSHARERERPSLYETMSTSYDIPLESRSPA